MEFSKVPCLFMPTQIVMVDDNLSFLENIRLTIQDYKNIILFSNPVSAINMLSKYQSKLREIDITCNLDCDEIDEENALALDYQKLGKYIDCSDEISVLIVDYSMPEMNGIDFLTQLKFMPAKKIMLTGEADNKIAVDAFNAGLIDKFIIKNGSKINETLCNYVNDLKMEYFLEMGLNRIVSVNSLAKDSPNYIKLVNNWIKSNSIIRFYQIDRFGSLFGLDKNNNSQCFYLLDQKGFEAYHEIAESQKADSAILSDLSHKIKMPVFTTDESLRMPADEWRKLLHSVEDSFNFEANNYYYCSVTL